MKIKFKNNYIIVALATMIFLIGSFLFLNINSKEENSKESYVQGIAPTSYTQTALLM